MAALSATPKTTLHVGDSLDADYQGARAAGMAAVHLRRKKQRGAGDVATIQDLDELEEFLVPDG
jgi:FMN phosphatase YigB (HAD superfamily)